MLVLLLAGSARGAAQDAGGPSAMMLGDLGRGTQPLSGEWAFRTGDDPGWAAPGLDDAGWARIQAGASWETQGYYGYTGVAWYRRHLVFPAGRPRDWKLGLFLPRVENACDVYWNGRYVGSIGKLPPHAVWYLNNPPAGAFTLGDAASGVLAIRAWRAPVVLFSQVDEGGLVTMPEVGSEGAIRELVTANRYEWLRANQFNFGVVLLSFPLAVLSVLMWFRYRERMLLLWLAIVMVYPLEQCVNTIPGLLPFRAVYGTVGVAIAIYNAALWFLLIELLGLSDHPRLVRRTEVLAATLLASDLLDGSLQLFDWTRHAHAFLVADVVFTVPAVLLEFWGVVLVLFAFRKRLDTARWVLAIAALLANLYQAMDDVTGLGVRWTHWNVNALLYTPLFHLGGSPLNAQSITGTLLLGAILYAGWRYALEQTRRQGALEREYHSAQEVQRVLIPDTLPVLPGYAVTSAYRPAQEVGGDFFQIVPVADGGALIVLGDVSGKGLHAAMSVSFIVGVIRSAVETTADPAKVLAALNRRLYGRLQGGFATCLALHVNARGECRLANAGHLPPYLNGVEQTMPPALPLGLIAENEYELAVFAMAEGDRLTLYTDGLLEARNHAGELFGFTRIAELLVGAPDAPEIADAAQRFGQEDDITILALTFAAA